MPIIPACGGGMVILTGGLATAAAAATGVKPLPGTHSLDAALKRNFEKLDLRFVLVAVAFGATAVVFADAGVPLFDTRDAFVVLLVVAGGVFEEEVVATDLVLEVFLSFVVVVATFAVGAFLD